MDTSAVFCGVAAQRGPERPYSRGFQITHNDAPQSVWVLWTSDQSVAETSTWQHTTLKADRHPCPPVEFEPANPSSEGPQTHALDRAATGPTTVLFTRGKNGGGVQLSKYHYLIQRLRIWGAVSPTLHTLSRPRRCNFYNIFVRFFPPWSDLSLFSSFLCCFIYLVRRRIFVL